MNFIIDAKVWDKIKSLTRRENFIFYAHMEETFLQYMFKIICYIQNYFLGGFEGLPFKILEDRKALLP